MIKVDGNTLWRGGEKIGWVENYRVYDHNGYEIGYYENERIYDAHGKEIGWIKGDYIETHGGRSIRLDDNRWDIEGGDFSDLARAAVRLLLGD